MHVTLLLNARYFSDASKIFSFLETREKTSLHYYEEFFSFAHVSPSLSLSTYIERLDDDDNKKKRRGRKKKMGLDLDSCIERVRARRVFARLSLPLSLSRARFFLHLFFSL